jgi:hypothetical protein
MNRIAKLCRAAAVVGVCAAVPGAWAAAPVGIETELPSGDEAAAAPPASLYELDTEMVVHNWVMCISANVAEQLVRAREEGVEQALSAYDGLKQERKCGRFGELRVILQEPLYKSAAESGHDARAFGALVNLADSWASVFLVTGGLPEE